MCTLLFLVFEVPPPSKRTRTMKDKGVKQLQSKALDSKEIGEDTQEYVLWCTHVQLYHNLIPTGMYTIIIYDH